MDRVNGIARQVAVVVGGGVMGCDIAAIFLRGGWRVVCVSRDPARRGEREERIRKSVSQMGACLDPAQISQCENLDAIDWSGVSLVIETVPEDLELKRSVFSQLDRLVPRGVPIGSNASGFPISSICAGLDLARQSVGLHFFLPAHLVPLVEVVSGTSTEAQIVDQVHQIMQSLGRVPVKVKRDSPGFLANRIQHALMREVFSILDEGLASPEDVDAAVRFGFGMRYIAAGPLLQKEFAGLDTQLAAARSIYPALSTAHEPSRTLSDLVAKGRFGTKSLHGFWKWTPASAETAKRDYEKRLLAALQLSGSNEEPTSIAEAME